MQPSCSSSQRHYQCPPPDHNLDMSTNRQQLALSGGKFPSPVFPPVSSTTCWDFWAVSAIIAEPRPCMPTITICTTHPKKLVCSCFFVPPPRWHDFSSSDSIHFLLETLPTHSHSGTDYEPLWISPLLKQSAKFPSSLFSASSLQTEQINE